MSSTPSPLAGVKALLFDVFGTVVNWEGSVHKLLEAKVAKEGIKLGGIDLLLFTREWRAGYMRRTREIAEGAPGPTNVDQLHRELLDDLLDNKPEYAVLAQWDDASRAELTQFWHQLDGWPDASPGIQAVKDLPKGVLVGTLSNGSARLLIDLSRHANLNYDFIFSGDLLKAYKPNPAMYLGACTLLDLKPEECCMVAAHIYDCRFAASFGLKTIYVPRTTEDQTIEGFKPEDVKCRADGGEVDVVAHGLGDIAKWLQ